MFMNDQEFLGKWVGVYTYGEDCAAPLRGKKVLFEIHITSQNGFITGDCIDEEATPHFKEPARIEGSVHGNTISFVKRYPYYWQNEENGPRFLPKLPSQEVHYSGQFINGQFEGEWEVITALTDGDGSAVTFKGTGYWFMKKAA
jgi:hypothetical protein